MEGGDNSSQEKATEEPPKRGRGRPRKEKPEEPEDAEPKPKRPRGRPKGSFKKTRPTEEKPKGPRGRPRKSPESPKKPEKKTNESLMLNSPNTLNFPSELMVSNACPSQPENNYIGLNVTEAEPTCAEDNNTTASLNVPLSTDSTRSRLQVIPRQKIKPDDLTRMQYEVMVEQKKKLQEQTTFYRLMNRKLRIEMGLPNKD